MPHNSYTTQILQCTTAGVTSLRANKDSFLLGVNLKVTVVRNDQTTKYCLSSNETKFKKKLI